MIRSWKKNSLQHSETCRFIFAYIQTYISFAAFLQILAKERIPRRRQHSIKSNSLVDSLRRRHGRFDDQGAHVLPALLQQTDQVVDGQHDVGDQLVLGHSDVADGDTHAQNLLQLELDGRLDFGHLVVEIFGVGDGGGEFSGCKKR